MLNSDAIGGVTSIQIIRPAERKEFEAIPVASTIFLSPDSTQLLLAGERFGWGNYLVPPSYCFGAIEVLDISGDQLRSLYRVLLNPPWSEGDSERPIKACRMEWKDLSEARGGRCPKCLKRYQSEDPAGSFENALVCYVEQVWSTPDGALLLRLSLKEKNYEYGNGRTKELGVLYILI